MTVERSIEREPRERPRLDAALPRSAGQRVKASCDLRNRLLELAAARRMTGRRELPLELRARQLQRFDFAHALGVYLTRRRRRATFLGGTFFEPLRDPCFCIDKTFAGITHG
jgi:hypothetical protein